jgi:hypothetical protein
MVKEILREKGLWIKAQIVYLDEDIEWENHVTHATD